MAYVYRHIRLDKNEVFYVGIGSDTKGFYTRANVKGPTRNKHWHSIVNKFGYRVEIIIDDISWEEAIKKEIEFIALYGRKDLQKGPLINLTDGGEGNVGYITSEEAKKKQSLAKLGKPAHNKGRPMPQHVKDILRKTNTGRPGWNKGIPQSEEHRRKNSLSKIGLMVGEKHPMFGKKQKPDSIQRMREKLMGHTPWNKGKKYDDEWIKQNRERQKNKVVFQYDIATGLLIKSFVSLSEAARIMKCSKGTLANACIKRGKLKTFRGFEWSYTMKESPEENSELLII